MSLALRGKAGTLMAVGAGAALLVDWLSGTIAASLIGVGFVIALAAAEFYDMAEKRNLAAFKAAGVAASAALLLLAAPSQASRTLPGLGDIFATLLCFLLWWLALSAILPRPARTKATLRTRLGLTVIGIAYVGLLGSFIIRLRSLPQIGLQAILLVLIIAKGGDVVAYLVGSAFGRHKLASSVSPNKSIEGSAANLGIAMLLALLVTRFPGMDMLRPWQALLFGAVVSAAAQAGDLLESKVKRKFGAKDSSSIVPGFGGVLDVIDCLLLAAPAGYFMLKVMETAQVAG